MRNQAHRLLPARTGAISRDELLRAAPAALLAVPLGWLALCLALIALSGPVR